MDFILNRMREPSTWAGIAGLGAAFGIPAEYINVAGQVVIAGASVAAILLREKAKPAAKP